MPHPMLPLLLLALLPAADDPPAPATRPATEPWPKLDAVQAKELGIQIESLKRVDADLVAPVAERIAEFGKGAVPFLHESMARQKPEADGSDPEIVTRLLLPLDRLVDAGDELRVAKDATHRSVFVRRFSLRKLGAFGSAEALPVAKKALQDKDEETRFEATLACFALGSIDGLPELLAAARDRWPRVGRRIRAAVERNRSEEATERLLPHLGAKEWQDVCAALRLLAGVGTKRSVHTVARHLDSTDHRIKEDAINALRGIVDGEPPLERLSAFDLAEMAAAWRKKI